MTKQGWGEGSLEPCGLLTQYVDKLIPTSKMHCSLEAFVLKEKKK